MINHIIGNQELTEEQEIIADMNNDGTIDIIATDHAPHAAIEKLCPMEEAAFGISNLETTLASALSLVHNKKLSLNRMIESITSSPALLLESSNHKIGQLSKGFSADVTLFDLNGDWNVDTGQFVSKGKNSPLHGQKLKGKVVLTIYKGQIVYSELKYNRPNPKSKNADENEPKIKYLIPPSKLARSEFIYPTRA